MSDFTSRSGTALLEVLVAMTLLVLAGTVALDAAQQAVRVHTASREREREVRRASGLLSAFAAGGVDELRSLAAASRMDGFVVDVRPDPDGTFGITIRHAVSRAEILRTSVHPQRWRTTDAR